MPSGSVANVGRVLTFRLGADEKLPELEALDEEDYELPVLDANMTEDVIAAGLGHYAQKCSICHGDQAYSSGLIPQLRFSAVTKDAELWREVLLDGILAENGMPDFKNILSEEDAEAIRAYVISEANSDRGKAFYDSVSLPK